MTSLFISGGKFALEFLFLIYDKPSVFGLINVFLWIENLWLLIQIFEYFREFLKICYTALQINSKLITSDQNEYQEALRQNYKKLCTSLSTLFGEPLWPHEETGSFKRNSIALFSAISGASHNSSTA